MSDSEHMSDEEEEQLQSDSSSFIEDNQNMSNQQPKDTVTIQREENDHRCATYIFRNQDHTLGNLLRVVLNDHADVEFVGYSIPHPSDDKLNLRLQTLGKDSNQVLDEGFQTIQFMTKTIRTKFTNSMKQFRKIK